MPVQLRPPSSASTFPLFLASNSPSDVSWQPGFVELGYVENTSDQSTSSTTTGLDIPGTTISLTFGNYPIYFRFGGYHFNSTGGSASQIRLYVDGVLTASTYWLSAAANTLGVAERTKRIAASPGLHTMKLNIVASANTAHAFGTAADPVFLSIMQG